MYRTMDGTYHEISMVRNAADENRKAEQPPLAKRPLWQALFGPKKEHPHREMPRNTPR